MPLIVVDVESDGPCVLKHSMQCFGAIVVEPALNRTFYGETAPIHQDFDAEAMAVTGITRDKHLLFPHPNITMPAFRDWVKGLGGGQPVFISDNLAYDWQWINAYLLAYAGENPLGWSGRRIGDLWCGFKNDMRARYKHMRKTRHSHDPRDDARGNAECLLQMKAEGLNIIL